MPEKNSRNDLSLPWRTGSVSNPYKIVQKYFVFLNWIRLGRSPCFVACVPAALLRGRLRRVQPSASEATTSVADYGHVFCVPRAHVTNEIVGIPKTYAS